jgi:hypothetical protein
MTDVLTNPAAPIEPITIPAVCPDVRALSLSFGGCDCVGASDEVEEGDDSEAEGVFVGAVDEDEETLEDADGLEDTLDDDKVEGVDEEVAVGTADGVSFDPRAMLRGTVARVGGLSLPSRMR